MHGFNNGISISTVKMRTFLLFTVAAVMAPNSDTEVFPQVKVHDNTLSTFYCMKLTLSCIHHLPSVCILYSELSASTSFPWQNVIFPAFHRISSDKMLQSSAVSLRLTASGLQPPPSLSNRYIFIQNWPCTGAGHQSALCLQPLPRSASCLSGWGLVIELSVALFWLAISSFFPSLLQNHGPFILTQLLLKPGWAEW